MVRLRLCRGRVTPAESPRLWIVKFSSRKRPKRLKPGRRLRYRARIEILGRWTTAGCLVSPLLSSFPSMSSEEKDKPSPSPNRPLSWLKPKQSEKDTASITSNGDPTTVNIDVAKPAEDDLEPVSFFGLFKCVLISVPFPPAFLTPPLLKILHSYRGLTQCLYYYYRSSCWRLPGLYLRLFFFSFICHIHQFSTDGCFR